MDDIFQMMRDIMRRSLPIRELESVNYIVTVSVDPRKVKMEDKRTHEVFTMEDFNEREITLLACIAALEDL